MAVLCRMDVWDGDNDRIASLGVDSMKCPKYGSEMHNIGWHPDYFWQCPKCGHEEKIGGEKIG